MKTGIVASALFLVAGCAMQSMATRAVVGAITGDPESGNAFTRDNDPDFVRDALPFAIKLYETLLESDPLNADLHLATGSAYISYANGFLHGQADILPPNEHRTRDTLLMRAKNLYLRGATFVLAGLELEHTGITDQFFSGSLTLSDMDKQDVPFLYWIAAGYLGAIATDPLDSSIGIHAPRAVAMAHRALELNSGFNQGAIHDVMIKFYASAPASLGGSEERARYHFAQSLHYGEDTKASPYTSLAAGISVRNQDMEEFVHLLEQALQVDIDKNPDHRLVNVLAQRQARFLLDNRDRFILQDTTFDDEWDDWDNWEDWE